MILYTAIPVKERYPSVYGEYHVIFDYGTKFESAHTVSYDKEYSFHHPDFSCVGITHWLELSSEK